MSSKKFARILAIAFALVLSAFWVSGPVQASHPQIPLTFTYQPVETIDPGESWVDEAGMHIRNRQVSGILTGDIEGTVHLLYNADLTPLFFWFAPPYSEGTAYGAIEIYKNDVDLSGPWWTGTFEHRIHELRVIGGKMGALSLDGFWVLQVDDIQQWGTSETLVHQGSIGHNNCWPECEPSPNNGS